MLIVDTKRQDAARQRQLARQRFARARVVEHSFAQQLSAVGRQVGQLIKGIAPHGVVPPDRRVELHVMLQQYSQVLRPWATAVTARMQAQVSQRDTQAWEQLASSMGKSLRRAILGAPVLEVMRNRLAEQVHLITSLPIEAGQRVQDLTVQAMLESRRADEIAQAILRSGQVAANRARLIARTEVARTASVLTQVRAEYIGSQGYIWRTSDDAAVRSLHKKLEGRFIPWNKPPVSGENGERAHAGQIYNCRCWPEPVVPDVIVDSTVLGVVQDWLRIAA